ncbi:MAG: hypothetical protein LBD37_10215 [Treponema sp.]|jgi:hypothetical protein|nr:hypothetical protein [Treponema sp.]
MKKPLLAKIAQLVFLYLAVFTALALMQFAKQRGFTRRVGPMLITGRYGETPGPEPGLSGASGSLTLPSNAAFEAAEGPQDPADTAQTLQAEGTRYSLAGALAVAFGGMEFRIAAGEPFALRYADGSKRTVLPEYMVLFDNAAAFGFPQGTELIFSVTGEARHTGPARPELRIAAVFGEGVLAVELPCRPLRRSRIREGETGELLVAADGINYSFGNSPLNRDTLALLLEREGPPVSYKAVAEQRVLTMAEYIQPRAQNPSAYDQAASQWRDRAYALWSRAALDPGGGPLDESQVSALLSESIVRGAYQQTVAGLARSWENQRTHFSMVYQGQLDEGFRSFINAEEISYARLAESLAGISLDFLLQDHSIPFCGIRGYDNLMERLLERLRGLEPSHVTPDLIPGILEGYVDWNRQQPAPANPATNPFTPLMSETIRLLLEGIRQEGDGRVFFFLNGQADGESNLRIGLALDQYGQLTKAGDLADLGRSLVLSVLAPEEPIRSAGEAARLYRRLNAPYYPHAAFITRFRGSAVWAWTAAAVEVSQTNDLLDIRASFPPEETHYMLIRGIQPFRKIQLYDMDFRTDPQLERYDSSGWTYAPEEQVLLLKMKHRTQIEHIRIFFPPAAAR